MRKYRVEVRGHRITAIMLVAMTSSSQQSKRPLNTLKNKYAKQMLKQKFIVKRCNSKIDSIMPPYLYYIKDGETYKGGFHTGFSHATRYDSYGEAEAIIIHDKCEVGYSYAIDKVYEVEGN
jgi:hypothetical protein